MDGRYLIGLEHPACTDPQRVGAKAAVLAELAQGGFAVPEALVLTVEASRAAADELMPEAVERALIRAAHHFRGAPVAVRSSSPSEDLAGASHAGQYESVLGVTGAEALRAAVRRCWASAAGQAARAYRREHGAQAAPRMAVLIQRQVTPSAAGVAFSAEPVAGDRMTVVIEAVQGLAGDALAGRIDPERWEVPADGAPRRRSGPRPVLSEAAARRVAELARRVAAHRGNPQDVEWALDDAGLWLLQARPITALPAPPPEPVPVPVEVPAGYWEREPVHAPRPHTPMNRSLLNPRRTEAMRRVLALSGDLLETIDLRDIGGWEYVRLVPLGGTDRRAPPAWLFGLLLRVRPALRRRAAAARRAVAGDLPITLARRWFDRWRPDLEARAAALRDTDLPALTDQGVHRHLDEVLAYVDDAVELHFLLHGTQAEPLYELATACRELLGWSDLKAMELVCGLSATSTGPAQRLGELARYVSADDRLVALLADGGPDALASMAALDAGFAERLAAYRRGDGFRGLRYEVAEPTLAERADLLAQLIRDQVTGGVDATAAEAGAAERREQGRARARAALAARSEGDRRRFEKALSRAETVYPVREDNEYLTVGVSFALCRAAALELGRRLADRGQLAERADVFFLELDEARAALTDGSPRDELIRQRKSEHAWIEAHPGPPSYGRPPSPPPSLRWAPEPVRRINEAVLWYIDREFASGPPGTTDRPATTRLDGIAASPGRYTGPVRVIRGEAEFDRLRPGDVCVCPVTSPVWSVVFASMGALVTDVGGVLSHPAIIAREYRIPAVVATGNATALLRDGQQVTVDGSAGIVEVA